MQDLTEAESNRKLLGERLRTAISASDLTIDAFASGVGASLSGVRKWLSGAAEPAFSSIAIAAKITKVRLDWLATGEGPMRPGEAAPALEPAVAHAITDRATTDRELMGRCIDAINKLYQELNIKMPMVDMGREAADLHDEIAASGAASLEEQLGAIRFAIAQRRRALLTAPPSSKHQGSA